MTQQHHVQRVTGGLKEQQCVQVLGVGLSSE